MFSLLSSRIDLGVRKDILPGPRCLWLGVCSKVLLLTLFLIGLSGGHCVLVKSTRVLPVSFRVGRNVWLYRLIQGLPLAGGSFESLALTSGGFEGLCG